MAESMIPIETLIPVKEVAKQLGVNPSLLRTAIARGDLQAYKLGNMHQTTQTWLNEWLTKQKVQAGKQ